MKTHSYFLVLVVTTLLGCGSSREVQIQSNLSNSQFDRALQSLVADILKQNRFSEGVKDNEYTAILDLGESNPQFNRLGQFLSDEFSTRFTHSGIPLVERTRAQAILSELRLNQGDLFRDSKARKEFGKLASAEMILDGTISSMGQDVRLNLKIVSIETGDAIAGGSVSLSKEWEEVAGPLGLRLPGELMVEADDGTEVLVGNAVRGTVSGRELQIERIDPGRYPITLRQRGYYTYEGTVEIREKRTTSLKADLKKLPGIEAGFMSLLFPGWGNAHLGSGKWYYWPIAVAGMGGLSFIMHNSYRERYDDYLKATNPDSIKKFYDEANSFYKFHKGALYAAAGIWLLDVIISFAEGASNGSTYGPSMSLPSQIFGVIYDPRREAMAIRFQFDF